MARYRVPGLSFSRFPLAVAIAVALWVGVLAGGFGLLWAYKTTPAVTAGQPPERWPSRSRIRPAAGRSTLVLFAHPRCPCTRASIAELARLMGRVRDRLDAHVLMVRPEGVEESWDQTALRDSAARIPGVRVWPDDGGREAERFGAAASGAAVVYDAGGRLAFHGGLTASRGHEGESAGQRRIVSLLTTGGADRAESPIYGCSLIGPTAHVPDHHRTASKEVVE